MNPRKELLKASRTLTAGRRTLAEEIENTLMHYEADSSQALVDLLYDKIRQGMTVEGSPVRVDGERNEVALTPTMRGAHEVTIKIHAYPDYVLTTFDSSSKGREDRFDDNMAPAELAKSIYSRLLSFEWVEE